MARFELNGNSVAPGIGVGAVFVALATSTANIPVRRILPAEVNHAWEMLDFARQKALSRLLIIQEATARELGLQDAAIYAAQAAVLQDPEALRELRSWIHEDLLAPESAIQALLDKFGKLFESLEGGDMKSWAADLRDPWNMVLGELGQEDVEHAKSGELGNLVLVAEELTPLLVVSYPRDKVSAILCARGGRYSHGAVLARSFGIPTVTGLPQVDEKLQSGDTCIVFGDSGQVLVGADDDETAAAIAEASHRDHVREVMLAGAKEAGRTADGTEVKIRVNIESPRDLDMFDIETVNGIGLFRTEFVYMERPSFPTAQEQAEIYARVLERFPNKTVVFRTLDVGGDKQLRYFKTPKEENPALGWRGIRLSLEWTDLFLMQLQALRECRDLGRVNVMLPMVTNLDEVRRAKKMLQAIAGDKEIGIRFGVMIEVPAAAMALPDIVKEVDFISVGTNDLVQYLFAVDRDNSWVSDLYQPYHPAHLRVLRFIARTCIAAGKPVTVCGEMAGQAAGAFFLTGCGYTGLSMSPHFVPEVKALLRQAEIEALRSTAVAAAKADTAAEAYAILEESVGSAWQKVIQSVEKHNT
ncbi:MAG: phosphoenolpyruvate--protein phosphotransferase [Planctomycetota bacterium]|jgi:phosphotransferase system enzyme I (PtsI)|nr:phosphoenolpyruvate--protein phosphotransferase [Planctomycetota bacterium]